MNALEDHQNPFSLGQNNSLLSSPIAITDREEKNMENLMENESLQFTYQRKEARHRMEKLSDNLFNSSACSKSIVVADLLAEYQEDISQRQFVVDYVHNSNDEETILHLISQEQSRNLNNQVIEEMRMFAPTPPIITQASNEVTLNL